MYDVLGATTVATGATGAVLAAAGYEKIALFMGIAFIVLVTVFTIATKAQSKKS